MRSRGLLLAVLGVITLVPAAAVLAQPAFEDGDEAGLEVAASADEATAVGDAEPTAGGADEESGVDGPLTGWLLIVVLIVALGVAGVVLTRGSGASEDEASGSDEDDDAGA